MADLPQELINEILLWLPVKSLLRFRCVSKLFCATIESQSFINSHFQICSGNRNRRKLIELGVYETNHKDLQIHVLDFNNDFQQELVLDILLPSNLYPVLFSYCNGLVLLCIHKLFIWNPSTSRYRMLPPVPAKHKHKISFALGYDSSIDDYKAVVIIWKKAFSQVWIFELRSSCWRRIQDFPYEGFNSIAYGGNRDCFVDGDLYFVMCRDIYEFESYIPVAFDVTKETFSTVPSPAQQGLPICLNVFRGCLCVVRWTFTREEQVDVYVRKKDGVAFTWTKLYSVTSEQLSGEGFCCFIDGRVACSEEGDTVFYSSSGKLCLYDFGTKICQEIATTDTSHLDMFSCTESLVSVGS